MQSPVIVLSHRCLLFVSSLLWGAHYDGAALTTTNTRHKEANRMLGVDGLGPRTEKHGRRFLNPW